MKTYIKLMLLMLIPIIGMAQRSQNDSLKNALKTARTDSARLSIFVNLALLNEELNRDTALYYYEQAIKVAKKNNQQLAEAFALGGRGYMLRALGKFPESLACYQQALKLAEDPAVGNRNWYTYPFLDAHNERLALLSLIHQNFGELMRVTGDIRQALFQEKLAKQLAEDSGSQFALGLSYMSMGYDYLLLKQPDSSLIMDQKAKLIFEHVSYKRYLGYVFEFIAKINLDKGNIAGALQNYHKAIQTSIEQKNFPAVVYCYSDLTNYYLSAKQKDSSLFYAKKTLETLRSIGSKDLGVAFENIYSAYKLAGNADSIYKYQGLALTAKDSSFQAATKSLTDFQKLSFQAQIHAQELEKEKDAIQTKIRTYALLAGIGVLMLLAGIFYRNNRQKQKANLLLSRQKDEIEAQARESQIEAALERVRSRTMAMQKSEELAEVIQLIFDQFVVLNFNINAANFNTDYRADNNFRLWIASSNQRYPSMVFIPYFDHPGFNIPLAAKDAGSDHYVINLTFSEKNQLWDHFFKNSSPIPDAPADVLDRIYNSPGYYSYGVLLKTVSLIVTNYQGSAYTEAEEAVIMRFGKVFEQTYTRFKDLEQAEEQARESQIQLGLERVRARTMAMQNSEELKEVIQVVFEQLVHLGIDIFGAGFTMDYKESDDWHLYAADVTNSLPTLMHIPHFDHPYWDIWNDAKRKGLDSFGYTMDYDEKNRFSEQFGKYLPGLTEEVVDLVYKAPGYTVSNVMLKNVSLYVFKFTTEPYSDEDNAVLMRFGKVFEQTYTRFKDLEQAEAQAREAKIEAALERVRSRTMAMQKSEELVEVIQLIFNQFVHLGFNISAANFSTDTLPGSYKNVWLASSNRSYPASVFIPDFDHPVFTIRNNAIEKGSDHYVVNLTEVETKQFWAHFFKNASPLPDFPADIRDRIYNSPGYYSYTAIMKSVSFTIVNYLGYAYTEAEQAVVMRFGKVFDQTYTRFKDLEQAEEQAREAKIEAALEKVRSRSLAMNKADELHEIVNIVFEKMMEIGFDLDSINIAILDEKTKSSAHWIAVENLRYVKSVHLPYYDNPINKDAWEAFFSGVDYFAKVFSMEEKNQFYSWAFEYTDFKYVHPDRKAMLLQTEKYAYSIAFGKVSFIQAVSYSGKILTEKEADVLKRFERVFEQAYVRFQDLQKAAERARETVKQASLDRVRGEIASMRTTKDLERIIPLVWNELTILGIPFIRCGVFIADGKQQCIHTHLSTPDGRALATFDLPFDAEGIGQIVLPAWRNNQIATGHWTAEQFAANTKSLLDQGAITSNERYVTEHPDSSLDLHFFPFLQGMLYVGNLEPLKESEKELVLALAEAFSTAYARYEDFNKLEAAKQQVDHALAGLKSAQTQLIQNEKMASLGELTAGIAHEIQNPLNFVNNFSEVSVELLTELKEEEAKGNTADVIAIANDLTQNLEKIRHHGKRAEAIVKGMLEHSRSATGQKEPTDINQLADEYIRLSYHGLRAKDKSFNADLVTHFDSMLPKVNAIPQDIGRVLLNLFNNAFYAVNQKAKTAGADYKPEVSVATSTENGQVIIKVKDNGIGIPDNIKEKIMQPFFTTKPTGEGTGLGLSLTYDMVVKGHGGSIQIESKEGVGSEFIIKLPIT